MNLTQPPFDDIHVRQAMNWVMDKAAMVQAWGGPSIGKVANHIVPDTIFDNQLAEFDPYRTPGDHGSVAKAKAAMKGSKYDTNGDGTCSASACKNVLLLTDTHAVDTKLSPVVAGGAPRRSGSRSRCARSPAPTRCSRRPRRTSRSAEFPGWGKDYADPFTFFKPLFDGRTIIPTGNVELLARRADAGAREGARADGHRARHPERRRADSTAARRATGQARLTCYESLDRTLMTKVVPVGAVPLAEHARTSPGRP